MPTIKPHPYKIYAIPANLLLIIGIFSSLYLSYLHYKNYTDITFSSICAISKSINCDTVAQSSFSIFLSVPLAFWSFLYFLFLFLISVNITSTRNTYLWFYLLCLGLLGSIFSVYLGYLSTTQIKSLCILCSLNYICILIYTFYCWLISRRFTPQFILLPNIQLISRFKSYYFFIRDSLFFRYCNLLTVYRSKILGICSRNIRHKYTFWYHPGGTSMDWS